MTSELSETELRRLALRAGGESAILLAERLIAKLTTIPLTITILREAGVLPPPRLAFTGRDSPRDRALARRTRRRVRLLRLAFGGGSRRLGARGRRAGIGLGAVTLP